MATKAIHFEEVKDLIHIAIHDNTKETIVINKLYIYNANSTLVKKYKLDPIYGTHTMMYENLDDALFMTTLPTLDSKQMIINNAILITRNLQHSTMNQFIHFIVSKDLRLTILRKVSNHIDYYNKRTFKRIFLGIHTFLKEES